MYIQKPIEQILGSKEFFCEVCDIYGIDAQAILRNIGLTLHVIEDTEINHSRYSELNNFFRIHAARGAIKDYENAASNTVRRVRYSGHPTRSFKKEEFLYVPVTMHQSIRLEIITIDKLTKT
jgi:hypothetical protein